MHINLCLCLGEWCGQELHPDPGASAFNSLTLLVNGVGAKLPSCCHAQQHD